MTLKTWARRRLGPRRVAHLKGLVGPFIARDLTRLGRWYGTDKAYAHHAYTPIYERHLRDRRRAPLRILEIGIGGYQTGTGGSSLRMWRDYFPHSTVVGLDIERRDLHERRVMTYQGDQTDRALLERISRQHGPFDLIIDDGSHRSSDIIATFEILWPLLAEGGTYAIEDLHTSYKPEYGGGPPGTPGTAMEFVKSLADRVQDREVAAVHVHPALVIIDRSPH